MGEVYRARDTRLKRDVAVKVLRDHRAIDADRIARFTREAHLLASLNHQNIAAIYGVEEIDGLQALVLELVEGLTLAERLRRGPIPLAEAMPIARQIAEALEAAHHVGIVHRDLKPANVKLRPDGTVKVLDFGLAKIVDPPVDIPGALSATTTHQGLAISERGMILGTAAYMSPEQARGDPVDKRTDIWAFGCCLYEALTGRAPFGGSSASDTIAQVLEREPDFAAVKAPPKVVAVLRRCLRKDPGRRLRDIADVRLELEEALAGDTDQTPADSTTRTIAALAALAAVLALALVAAVVVIRGGDSQTMVTRSMIAPPRGGAFFLETEGPAPAVVSPDGTQLAFGAIDEHGVRRLWVRRLDELNPRVLPGTEDARYPFWSHDGRSLGFFTFQELKRIDLEGGRARTLADVPNGKGGAWNEAGVILFAPASGPLLQMPAAGGSTRAVTVLDTARGEDSHRNPRFLPDGRRFLFVARHKNLTERHLLLASLEGGTPEEIGPSESHAEVAGNYLFLIRGGALVALPFDVTGGRVTGEPIVVAETAASLVGAGLGLFSVSPSGVLAYHKDWTPEKTALYWYDRSGKRVGSLGALGVHISVELSPDGAAAAVVRTDDSGNEDVWIYDARSETAPTRLTVDRGNDIEPIWSPDGTRVAFTKGLQVTTTHIQSVAGGSPPVRIDETHSTVTGDWAPDGRHIVGFSAVERTGDLWLLPLEGGAAGARPLQKTPFREWQPDITSDGKWLAYSSDESGRQEIMIERFPDGGRKRQISTAGGSFPEWNAAGDELFFLDENNVLNAVSLKSAGDVLSVSSPKPLFQTRARFGWTDPLAVAPDGQRFLINTVDVPVAPTPVTIVVGWPSEVAKRRQR